MMTLTEAMAARHSVRRYEDRPLEGEKLDILREEIEACNREGGLHLQLVVGEPGAFGGFMARYGKFEGVDNYIALVGKKGGSLEERCGRYGELLVLLAQQLGLNSCWVGLTYSRIRSAFVVGEGEKLCAVIALSYGRTQGVPHRSKAVEEVSKADGPMPDWFRKGARRPSWPPRR